MKYLFICSIVFYSSCFISQDSVFLKKKYLKNQSVALSTLSSWSLLNLSLNSTNLKSYSKSNIQFSNTDYFHQMNFSWNLVNSGICVIGFLKIKDLKKDYWTNTTLNNLINKNCKTLSINVGLDIAYITTGLILRQYATQFTNSERSIGFGNSLITQGSFLLVFDLIYLRSLRKLIH